MFENMNTTTTPISFNGFGNLTTSEDAYLCDTAIAINSAPQFLDTRLKDQIETWVPRVCKKNDASNVLGMVSVFTKRLYLKVF
jgi:hypothetical protein